MKSHLAAILVVGVLTSSCATGSEQSQSAATPSSTDEALERAERNLLASGYKIRNVDKPSRMIIVEFEREDPSRYVDCGKGFAAFHNPNGKTELQQWEQSRPSISYRISFEDGSTYDVKETRALSGEARIKIDAQGNSTTEVSATYWLLAHADWKSLTPEARRRAVPDRQIYLSSKLPGGSSPLAPLHERMACVSLGTLEAEVRDAAG